MNQIAIVTGGSNNIGWACAQLLAARHQVVIADVKAPAHALPEGMHFVATDVTSAQDCGKLVAAALRLGALQTVVHSAAITAPARPIEQISLDEWRRVIELTSSAP